jgi:hypothetical protein
VLNAIIAIYYLLTTGCQWQALPKPTAHFSFQLWDWDGTLERIHEAVYVAVREAAGREASPTAAIIRLPEHQSGSKRGSSLDPQGFDAGKKVTGRKRHILVDMLGLLFGVSILPADIQDRDGAPDLLRRVRRRLPFIERKFADTTQRKWQRRSQPQAAGRSRSSNAPISTASSFCRSDGSSSGHSHGSAGMPSRA